MGLSSALSPPSCGGRTLLGSLQCWSVGGTGGSVQVAFFALNPPEMTRQFSSAAWGRKLYQTGGIFRISVYLQSSVTKERAGRDHQSHLSPQVLSEMVVVDFLYHSSVGGSLSFAGSSPKHCEFLFCNSISSQIQSV